MTDETKLLSQFPHEWHVDDLNMWQHLVMEKSFTQLKGKETDFVWSKVSILLPFIVQSKFKFIYNDLELTVTSNIGVVVVGNLHSSLYYTSQLGCSHGYMGLKL